MNKSSFKPIFVVGNSRSGTTLMGSILGRNPEVFTFEELHFFGTLWTQSDRDKKLDREEAEALAARLLAIQDEDFISYKNPELFASEAQQIVSKLDNKPCKATDILQAFLLYSAQKNGKQRPCEQTPRNVLYIGEILELYPDCRIINMVRDPRDVLLSQKNKWRIRFLGATNIPYREALRSWANYHPVTISKLWNVAINAAQKYRDRPELITIRFEDLIANPESTLRQVCDFLELEFESEMLAVSQAEGGVSSLKKIKAGQTGIDNSATGKWKKGGLSKAEVDICQKITQDNMREYKYQIEPIKSNPLSIVLSWIFLPFKLALALLLNLQRMRNILEEIKKRL
ncbi:MAG: sulfotransferase [Pleurocapsa sp.]